MSQNCPSEARKSVAFVPASKSSGLRTSPGDSPCASRLNPWAVRRVWRGKPLTWDDAHTVRDRADKHRAPAVSAVGPAGRGGRSWSLPLLTLPSARPGCQSACGVAAGAPQMAQACCDPAVLGASAGTKGRPLLWRKTGEMAPGVKQWTNRDTLKKLNKE